MESPNPPNFKDQPKDRSDVIPFADESTPKPVPQPPFAPAAPEPSLFADVAERTARPAVPPGLTADALPVAYDSTTAPTPAVPEIGRTGGLPWEAPAAIEPPAPVAPPSREPAPLPPAYDSASDPFPAAARLHPRDVPTVPPVSSPAEPPGAFAGGLPWEPATPIAPASGPTPAEPLPPLELPRHSPVVVEPPPAIPVLPPLSESSPEPFDLAAPIETTGIPMDRVLGRPIPPPAPPTAASRQGIFERHALLWLLLITILGGFFRFAWIDKPACWTDEAYTFRRVVASFQDLLDVLQNDGFGPLLYEFDWWLAQRIGGASHMTPFWLRLLPASMGTLMVPAMYFLARQLVSRRTSLVVALFTASSAYMMAYSHDAKMYMMLWLAVALNLGGLFWWFRTNLRVAWLAWIAAGVFVGGIHAPGLIVLGLQPIFLLTQKQMHWRKFLAFVAGMAVIASAPLVHYTRFNRMVDRIEDEGWGASGVTWVPGVLSGRGGEELAVSAASAYMYSWEWPRFTYSDDDSTNRYERNRAAAGGLMLQGFNINPKIMSGLTTAVCAVFGLCILGALPWTRRWRGERLGEEPVQPAWRLVFWLGLWVLLPAYVYYCITLFGMKGVGRDGSMPFVSPAYYWDSIVAIFPGNWRDAGPLASKSPVVAVLCLKWTLVLAVAGLLSAGLLWSGRAFRIVAASLAGALALQFLVFLGMALWKTGWTRPVGLADGKAAREWIEGWRAIRLVGAAFYDAATDRWMTWAWAMVLPAVGLQMCADTVLDRLKKALQLAAALAALFGALWLAHHFVSQELKPKTPQELGPIWMPRYLGAVWPAFAIAVCALLMRLPTRIFRVVAVCLLVGVNIAQACGRMFAGTEPPVDKMIAEVFNSQEPGTPGGPRVRSNFRTYIERTPIKTTHPAGTWVDLDGANPASKYYAALIRGKAFDPQVWRNVPLSNYVATIYSDTAPRSISADLRRNPGIDHTTVWDRFPELPEDPKKQAGVYAKVLTSVKAGVDYIYEGRKYTKSSVAELERTIAALQQKAAAPEPDPLLDLLGAGWKRLDDRWFQVRYHWNWSEIYAVRRREYVRVPVPPAQPVAAPVAPAATRPTSRPSSIFQP
ncbi:MAG: hypothetical protein ACHRHE_13785 [Tepidisphaerales bacterium]